jgi:glycine reductase complex component B subunit alpha and beta
MAESKGGKTLEVGEFRVRDVVMGTETAYRDGVLTVDREVIRSLVLRERRFADVAVDIVKPGERVRVHNVLDAVEPRVRLCEPGSDFPGVLGAPRTVGAGRTHRLAGLSVCEVSVPVPGEPEYWREAVFEASGPGAAYGPFGALANIVLSFEPNLDQFSAEASEAYDMFVGTPEVVAYNDAVRRAGIAVAVALAQAVRNLEPDSLVTYDLAPLSRQFVDLPRVVYLYQGRPYVYGESLRRGSGGRGELPTLIHPNELLDGALVNSSVWPACHRDLTYLIQTHGVIEDLYARHGHDLDFAGVIIYDRGDSARTKERNANYAANLVSMLQADGAILTYMGSGHPIVDVMMTCELLEKRGVQTVLLVPEMSGDADESGLADFVPEARAIVSTGNYEEPIELPPVEKVLGGEAMLESGVDASGPLSLTLRSLLASTDPFGSQRLGAVTW